MHRTPSTPRADVHDAPVGGGLPMLAAAELQDHLLVASNDLERLQRLLNDASGAMLAHFEVASEFVAHARGHDTAGPLADEAHGSLLRATTALQFHDMGTQLIEHLTRRLRGCIDRLAREALGGEDDDGAAVVETLSMRPNPVTQDELDAGSIELF